MIIISYATRNTPYEKVMEEYLLPTLNKFGKIKYEISTLDNEGSWEKNTHIKAQFIKDKLEEHKESVTFLDADAQILQYPSLLYELEEYDIGLHWLDWYKHWKNGKGNRFDALSGTLFLNYNDRVLEFLDAWIKENKKSCQWEQKNMQAVLERNKEKLNVYELPYSYISIIDHSGHVPKHMIKEEDIVILHNQTSRKYKRRIR